jgi:CheY-like chemotaxis protein
VEVSTKTVLIIDDDPIILETARRLLERDGLHVLTYNQGFSRTWFSSM